MDIPAEKRPDVAIYWDVMLVVAISVTVDDSILEDGPSHDEPLLLVRYHLVQLLLLGQGGLVFLSVVPLSYSGATSNHILLLLLILVHAFIYLNLV